VIDAVDRPVVSTPAVSSAGSAVPDSLSEGLTMPAPVSRRTVARGAAWAVPVVAIGAAAPLAAASDCPTLTLVNGTHVNGSSIVPMLATFISTSAGPWCVTFLSATGGRNTNNPNTLSYTGTTSGPNCASGSGTHVVPFVVTSTSNNGNNVRGTYTGTVTLTSAAGQQCTFTNQTITIS
jgi:hypothetical protein